jgi:hypothetical protein
MRPRIVIVAALGVLIMGLFTFRRPPQPSPTRTELPQPSAATDEPMPQFTAAITPTMPAYAPIERQPTTNRFARFLHGDLPHLTLEQLEGYLRANHRDATSLLAAYQASHERALLDEALAKYPNDPRVAYTAWYRAQGEPNDPGGLNARRQALEALKQADPGNALADYLSAANYFKSGQPALAMQEMQAGAGKAKYNDYTQEAIQSTTEAYLAAGYSEAEAKLVAVSGALLPNLAELKQAGLGLVELANAYQQSGDSASAQAAVQMSLELGQRLDDPNSLTLIQTLVGIAIQRKALDALAGVPNASAGAAIQNQIDALQQHRDDLKAAVSAQPMDSWLQTATDQDISAYLDRRRLFGEQRAMQWLANRSSNH